MNTPKELIAKMKSQHLTLKTDLMSALELSKLETRDAGQRILDNLVKFKSDLLEHLDLENKEFYSNYLNKQAQRGEDLTSTKEFIKQMDEIGEVVFEFLNKYNSVKSIEEAIIDFRGELSNIIKTLNVRIETEEDGIFDLYLII